MSGRRSEILDGYLAESHRLQRLTNRVGGGGLVELHLHHAATDEIDAIVEPDEDQHQHGRNIYYGREDYEEMSFPDEIKVDIGRIS